MRTFKDEYSKTWEAHTYGAAASGHEDGPPPEGDRMIAFNHPTRDDSTREVTTDFPDDGSLDDMTDEDLRELLAIARDSD